MKKYCVNVKTSGKYGNVVLGVRVFNNPIEGIRFANCVVDLGCDCDAYFLKKLHHGVWGRANGFWDNE